MNVGCWRTWSLCVDIEWSELSQKLENSVYGMASGVWNNELFVIGGAVVVVLPFTILEMFPICIVSILLQIMHGMIMAHSINIV